MAFTTMDEATAIDRTWYSNFSTMTNRNLGPATAGTSQYNSTQTPLQNFYLRLPDPMSGKPPPWSSNIHPTVSSSPATSYGQFSNLPTVPAGPNAYQPTTSAYPPYYTGYGPTQAEQPIPSPHQVQALQTQILAMQRAHEQLQRELKRAHEHALQLQQQQAHTQLQRERTRKQQLHALQLQQQQATQLQRDLAQRPHVIAIARTPQSTHLAHDSHLRPNHMANACQTHPVPHPRFTKESAGVPFPGSDRDRSCWNRGDKSHQVTKCKAPLDVARMAARKPSFFKRTRNKPMRKQSISSKKQAMHRCERLCNMIGTHLPVLGVESSVSLGSGERYRYPLRRIAKKIMRKSRGIHHEIALHLSIKAMNGTVDREGLIPSPPVFGTMPRFTAVKTKLPTQRERILILHAERAENATVSAELRVRKAPRSEVPRNCDLIVRPGDQVRVCREIDKSYVGPYPVLRVDRKQVTVLNYEKEVQHCLQQAQLAWEFHQIINGDQQLGILHSTLEKIISRPARPRAQSYKVYIAKVTLPKNPRAISADAVRKKEIANIIWHSTWKVLLKDEVPANANMMAQVPEALFDLKDIKQFNKSVRHLKYTIDVGLMMKQLDKDSIHLRVFSDASFANNEDLSSQLGYIVLLCDKHGNCNVLHYTSHKSRSVTRSVLGAEVYAFSDAFYYAFTMKHDFKPREAVTSHCKC